jgi:hypothetical protein
MATHIIIGKQAQNEAILTTQISDSWITSNIQPKRISLTRIEMSDEINPEAHTFSTSPPNTARK